MSRLIYSVAKHQNRKYRQKLCADRPVKDITGDFWSKQYKPSKTRKAPNIQLPGYFGTVGWKRPDTIWPRDSSSICSHDKRWSRGAKKKWLVAPFWYNFLNEMYVKIHQSKILDLVLEPNTRQTQQQVILGLLSETDQTTCVPDCTSVPTKSSRKNGGNW